MRVFRCGCVRYWEWYCDLVFFEDFIREFFEFIVFFLDFRIIGGFRRRNV